MSKETRKGLVVSAGHPDCFSSKASLRRSARNDKNLEVIARSASDAAIPGGVEPAGNEIAELRSQYQTFALCVQSQDSRVGWSRPRKEIAALCLQ